MKMLRFFIIVLVPLLTRAMESNSQKEEALALLNKQADTLIEQRNAVYDDVSQSGIFFMGIVQSFLDDSFQYTPEQEKAMLTALYKWKATAITRQLMKIDTQLNQLQNIQQEPEKEDITTTTFLQFTQDSSSFLHQLPPSLINIIKTEIDETEQAVKMATDILGEHIGIKLEKWMNKNNIVRISKGHGFMIAR